MKCLELKGMIVLFAIILSHNVYARGDSYEILLNDLENFHKKIIKRMENIERKKRNKKLDNAQEGFRQELRKRLGIEEKGEGDDVEFDAPLPPGEIPQNIPSKKLRISLKTPEDLKRALKKYNPGFQGKCKIKVEHGKIISVDLNNKNIVNVAPLGELKYVRSLDLSGNPITNITPLKKLKRLDWLELNNTFVSDLSPLKNLKLSGLGLSMTPITDLSPIKKMKLEELNLQSCVFLNNIDVIGKMKTLKTLILPPHFKLLHIDFIKRLKKLEYLDIRWRPEEDRVTKDEFLTKFSQYIE